MSFEVITKLRFNKDAGTFYIVEAGYKYEIPDFLYEDFKTYILEHNLVSKWYRQLSDEQRVLVKKIVAYS